MEEQKRFQNRKPNKADHQGITKLVKGGKVVVGAIATLVPVGLAVADKKDGLPKIGPKN